MYDTRAVALAEMYGSKKAPPYHFQNNLSSKKMSPVTFHFLASFVERLQSCFSLHNRKTSYTDILLACHAISPPNYVRQSPKSYSYCTGDYVVKQNLFIAQVAMIF